MLTRREVESKLRYALRRANDLEELNGGDLGDADPDERQQLVQEFFFHLGGAVDLIAQVINEKKQLGIAPDTASAKKVLDRLPSGPLHTVLDRLYFNVRRDPAPATAYMYTDEGFACRMWRYRHQVTHRWQNPFALRVGGGADVSYKLDPLALKGGNSKLSVFADNQKMLDVVSVGCQDILNQLGL